MLRVDSQTPAVSGCEALFHWCPESGDRAERRWRSASSLIEGLLQGNSVSGEREFDLVNPRGTPLVPIEQAAFSHRLVTCGNDFRARFRRSESRPGIAGGFRAVCDFSFRSILQGRFQFVIFSGFRGGS